MVRKASFGWVYGRFVEEPAVREMRADSARRALRVNVRTELGCAGALDQAEERRWVSEIVYHDVRAGLHQLVLAAGACCDA